MSDYWLKRALADEARAHQLAKQTTAELKKVYQRQYQRVYTQMERLYGQIDWGDTLTRTQLWQYSRWKTLEQELRSFATQTPRIGIDKITSCLNKVFAETIGADISRFSGAGGSVFRASGDALSLINTAWSGESFSARIWKNTATLAERIRSGMEDMLVSGRSLGDIKYQLMQDFSVGYNDASRLVQTEAAYVMNGAAKQRYKSAGIGKVRWSIAPEDGRECEICKAHANKVWHIENAPQMPAHPRCRCVWVAVVELPGENVPCTGEGEEADGEVKLPEEQKAKQSPEGTVRTEAPEKTAEAKTKSAPEQPKQVKTKSKPAEKKQAPKPEPNKAETSAASIEKAAVVTSGKTESPQAETVEFAQNKFEKTVENIKELLDKSGKFDKINTREYAEVMAQNPEIPDAKIYKFMLDPEKKHYRDFLEAGYVTAADGERLREDILRICRENAEISRLEWDDEQELVKYSQHIKLGPDGHQFRVCWKVGAGQQHPLLTTCFRKETKK